jgi:hypothetical protein
VISFKSNGSWSKTRTFLDRLRQGDFYKFLDEAGAKGVRALERTTPKETGLTASSWDYRIVRTSTGRRIEWFNTNVHEGVNIAIIIQYGHGTKDGTYVEGLDYVNPAMQPLFDELANDIWEEVIK